LCGPDSSNVLALMLYPTRQNQVPFISKPMWKPRNLVLNVLPT
jgi:hypothetical protein